MNQKKLQTIFLLFLLASSVFGNQRKIIKDDLGFPYTVSSPPQRIISLAPNITETLYALGLGKKVVGVTRFCDYPEDALKKEKIGGLVDPNLEKIIALNPDLIIGFRGNTLKILKRLRSLNLPVFALEMGTTIEYVLDIINKIGTVTQKTKESETLIRSLKEEHVKIQKILQDVHHEPKVFLSLHGMGFWTCGRDSFLDDLVNQARGINIAGKIPQKWLLYNREQLIHENPEVIIIISKSQEQFHRTKNWIRKIIYLKNIKAVKRERIYFLDENLATRPGPRIIQALTQLARALHPQNFGS